ncbi:MarR family winged helix-turn-helix transcriptional regulator [Streptomyces sp. NPDC059175]|uniref:MarR family winged helix-turn-helix transcriptional regulator n=1 Tax=unclassified Streptomyces TaxID=2593676 RepID=UPI0036A5AE09
MSADPPSSPRWSEEAARAACEVVELLEVLWERGREVTSTSPVSASQLRVLYCLEREDGINLRALGHMLGSAPSSASRLCDRLEAVGFVERTPSPVSRRELTLRLTGRGRSYLTDLRAQREGALFTAIQAMSPTARASLLEGLAGFRDAAGRGRGPARDRGAPPDSPAWPA